MTIDTHGRWNDTPLTEFHTGELVDYPVVVGPPSVEAPSADKLQDTLPVKEVEVLQYPDEMVSEGLVTEKRYTPKNKREAQRMERLKTIHEEYGFLPMSMEELTTAWGIHEDNESPARYLNRILLHQQKTKSEQPSKALFTKVDEVVRYIRASSSTDLKLSDFSERLNYMVDEDEEETFRLVGEMSGESCSLAALTSIVRHRAFESQFADVALGDIRRPDISQWLEGMDRLGVDGQIDTVKRLIGARRAFWVRVLDNYENHGAVGTHVRKCKKELGLDDTNKNTPF